MVTIACRVRTMAALLLAVTATLFPCTAPAAPPPTPLTMGETFTLESKVLGETRRISVYRPPSYTDSAGAPRPVLYMPDGGMAEDFLHVAGLLQVSVGNGTMRPFLLVGIENTQRRRDLTGPTESEEDRKIAPHVGGSAAFRQFLRSELMPLINARYPTTGETAIMGESLAGLFVVETLFTDPDLFDTYIAFDPSLWWNHKALLSAQKLPGFAAGTRGKSLYLAGSSDDEWIAPFVQHLRGLAPPALSVQYVPMPGETHATIYHPAALKAVRALFGPAAGSH